MTTGDDNDNNDGAVVSLVFATFLSIGGALIYYGNEGNIFNAVGGAMVGWVFLVFLFINMFASDE